MAPPRHCRCCPGHDGDLVGEQPVERNPHRASWAAEGGELRSLTMARVPAAVAMMRAGYWITVPRIAPGVLVALEDVDRGAAGDAADGDDQGDENSDDRRPATWDERDDCSGRREDEDSGRDCGKQVRRRHEDDEDSSGRDEQRADVDAPCWGQLAHDASPRSVRPDGKGLRCAEPRADLVGRDARPRTRMRECARARPPVCRALSRDVPASQQERGEGGEGADEGGEHGEGLRAVYERPAEGARPA